jgi:excisionase family DNA binding protein
MEPLAVPPEAACQLLGIRPSKVYALMREGELDSFNIGSARRITMASINDYIERRLADARASGWMTWSHNPIARREREESKAGVHTHAEPTELQSEM